MPTEKRIASTLVLLETRESVSRLNQIISDFSRLIIGRQGIPLRNRELNIISLVLEGNTDEIGAFAGQIGRLKGVKVKTAVIKSKSLNT